MAITVPDYGDQKVPLSGMSGKRFDDSVPSGAFGGGEALDRAGAAAEGANNQAFELAHRGWEQANQLKVLDADNQMNMFEVQQVYDPKTGALTKRGMDAFNLPEQVMGAFDKRAGEVAGKLNNDEQRISFTHLVNSRRFMLERVVGRHVDNEITHYNDQVANDSVKNAQDMAVANYTDPHMVLEQIAKQKAVLTDYAVRKGIPNALDEKGDPKNPILKDMITSAVSSTHAGVITQYAENGMSDVAQEYLTHTRGEMTPRDARVVEDTIRRRLPQDVASRVYNSVGVKGSMMADGSPDRDWAKGAIDNTEGLDAEQKLAAFNAFEAFANRDAAGLKRNNDGNSASFYSQVTDMANKGSDVASQKRVADRLAALLPDGSVDKYDLQMKYDFIEKLGGSGNVLHNEPYTLIALHNGLLDGSISSPQPILNAMEKGLLRPETAVGLVNSIYAEKSGALAQQWKQIEAGAEASFPIKEERDSFMATMRQQAIEQKITDPAKLNDLYKTYMAPTPSGERALWGIGWNKAPEYYASQETIHQNPELVRAMGGSANVFKIAQQMGGPDNFLPGTPYSKAALALLRGGFKPEEIMPASISAYIKKYPEKVK